MFRRALGIKSFYETVRFDPGTLTIMATVATIGSAAVSAMGAISAGNAQKAAADRQAQVDRQNAQLAQQDRAQAINTAEISAEDKRRNDSRQLAAIRAAYGSSGLELAGTPLDVLADTSTEMALDERRVSYQGQVAGRQDELRALGDLDSANSSEAAGNNAETAGYYGAGTSLLKGGGTLATSYLRNNPSTADEGED